MNKIYTSLKSMWRSAHVCRIFKNLISTSRDQSTVSRAAHNLVENEHKTDIFNPFSKVSIFKSLTICAEWMVFFIFFYHYFSIFLSPQCFYELVVLLSTRNIFVNLWYFHQVIFSLSLVMLRHQLVSFFNNSYNWYINL